MDLRFVQTGRITNKNRMIAGVYGHTFEDLDIVFIYQFFELYGTKAQIQMMVHILYGIMFY